MDAVIGGLQSLIGLELGNFILCPVSCHQSQIQLGLKVRMKQLQSFWRVLS